MSFAILSSTRFDRYIKRLAKKYISMPEDSAALLTELRKNPRAGEPLGRDCYKVRVSIAAKNKGKSGGARAITCVKIVNE